MTKRSILNTTSIKKRDVLLPTTNAGLDPDVPSEAMPAIFLPNRLTPPRTPAYTFCIPWIPTYRLPVQNASTNTYKSSMTTGTPYMKGLSENITISVTGGVPWQWRRICFTYKGNRLYQPFSQPSGVPDDPAIYDPLKFFKNTYENETAIFRPVFDLASYYGEPSNPRTSVPYALAQLYTFLFQGTSSQFNDNVTESDWINVMTAKTDNREVTVKYDKTVTLASGNEEGIQRNYKRYHPMEKTLVYDSYEQGNDTGYFPYSTGSKPGMGDYYIVDFFQARYAAGEDAGNLIFDPRATIYWHEK